jgi:hypothetical protein
MQELSTNKIRDQKRAHFNRKFTLFHRGTCKGQECSSACRWHACTLTMKPGAGMGGIGLTPVSLFMSIDRVEFKAAMDEVSPIIVGLSLLVSTRTTRDEEKSAASEHHQAGDLSCQQMPETVVATSNCGLSEAGGLKNSVFESQTTSRVRDVSQEERDYID